MRRTVAVRAGGRAGVHRPFTTASRRGHGSASPEGDAAVMEAAQQHADTIRIGVLEIHPTEGLALADGTALGLSVREFGLLVALAGSGGRIVRREDLFGRVWGGALRDGDRSIDVYVHKLRVKLEQALPDARYIH